MRAYKRTPRNCRACHKSAKKLVKGYCPLCDIKRRRRDAAYKRRERAKNKIKDRELLGTWRRCVVCGIRINRFKCLDCGRIHGTPSEDPNRCLDCFKKGLTEPYK